jgi:hypothetical protein
MRKEVAVADEQKPMDTIALLARVAASLSSEFESLRAIPHRGEAGHAVEDSLRVALERHLPARFGIRSGFVIGANREVSNQTDIIITDALNCPAFLKAPGSGIYPIDGIVGSIEVTSFLNKAKWESDRIKIERFRRILPASQLNGITLPPVGLIFAASSDAPLKVVAEWVADRVRNSGEDERQYLPNGVVVLDKGLVCYREVDTLSFDPRNADSVSYIDSVDIHLGVFLHLLTYEFRRVLERRTKAHLRHLILQAEALPQHALVGAVDDEEAPRLAAIVAAANYTAIATVHFPDFASYLGEDLEAQLLKHIKNVEI